MGKKTGKKIELAVVWLSICFFLKATKGKRKIYNQGFVGEERLEDSNNRDNMKREIADLRESLILIGAIIMLVGLGSAIWIYQSSWNDSDSVLGYEIINGTAYPIRPEDSRMYRRDLELYGGKTAVVADDFSRWFIGLWHGKSLAFTVAGISIFISFVFFFAANRLPFLLKSDAHSENKRE